METKKVIFKYLKFAVPLAALVFLLQNIFTPGTSLNYKMKTLTASYPFEFYMAERGAAQRDKNHGRDYYESLQLKVYDKK
jgi:hypothetical protein